MRRLLELLRANLHWVLLVVCEAIALLLLIRGSGCQFICRREDSH